MHRATTSRGRRELLALAGLALALLAVWPPSGEAAGIPREVHELMQRITVPIRSCYARELEMDASYAAPDPPPGVRAKLLRSGELRFELLETSGSARLDRCLRSALRRIRVRPPRDGRPLREQYPLLFMPDGELRVLRVH